MTSASTKFKPGDLVEWRSAQSRIEGTVVRKVTGTAHVKGHVVHATETEPQYEVESSRTGRHAIHKPEALSRRKST